MHKKIYSSKVFKKLLDERKVSVYRISKDTGIAVSTLSNWKNEHYEPKVDKVMKIADYFGVPITYFYE